MIQRNPKKGHPQKGRPPKGQPLKKTKYAAALTTP